MTRFWISLCSLHHKNNPANISTSDQRCFNVVDQHWNNVDPTLFNVAKSWYNVSARRWNNVKTTLHNVGTTLIQRCFNLVSTLVKSYIESNWASDDCGLWDSWIHVKYVNNFYSAKRENFYYILTIQLLMKYQKIF